ncbi:HAMP domain-containing histidine kinase [Acidihalobacter ferrooxydans]|uniref:histidine kinase n=1 Tax=Acidihalobacter ferrooxydans TaxID=1765967 RepID=A0A1P8UHQ8_9GAMM|nr:HAMP domain-containing histidine kinase [Acidihalobacter ferrooxydans]APZ43383.1 hypothetical protein BW247_10020 [Acidihalobacter ferrooxydans]
MSRTTVESNSGNAANARPRRRWSPGSLGGLVGFSFALVMLPLLVLALASAYAVHRLSTQSEQTVYEAVQLTQNSLILMEELVTMERSARQYQVVKDSGLLQVFTASGVQFQRAVRSMEALPVGPSLAKRVRRLAVDEKVLAHGIEAAGKGGKLPANMDKQFANLSNQAYQLWNDSSRLVTHRVETLRTDARRLQQFLLWGALGLVATSIVLGIGLSRLILRPVGQIAGVINRLGDGDFAVPVDVRGPHDLEYLGERLDWTRRRLLELEAGKQRFVRDVSHDLKTPLTTMLESVALLRDEVVGALNAEQTSLVRILHDSSVQLQKRIDHLIQYNRLQGQLTSLDMKALDLAQLVAASLEEHRTSLEGRKLRVVSRLDATPLWGDEVKLRQVVDNLLSNAIKYAPRGSMLKLDVHGDAHNACLRVADEGPGVAAADRPRIFDAFYRGAPPSGGSGVGSEIGSGIGLAIVKEYVEAHRGEVLLVQGQGGEGAVFEVKLPADIRGSGG